MKPLMSALAVGYVVFGLMLAAYQSGEPAGRRIPHFTAARLLQGLGMGLLCLRTTLTADLVMVAGYFMLLAGFALECGTLWRLSGRALPSRAPLVALALVAAMAASLIGLSPAQRVEATALAAIPWFALGGWACLRSALEPPGLRIFLGSSQVVVAAVLGVRAVWAMTVPPETSLFAGGPVHSMLYGALYLLMLTNGFGVLLLAKSATDLQLQTVLNEETAVLETLPSGLCILRDRIIVRCNPAMEAMLGWPPGSMQGLSTRCLYRSDEEYEHYGRLFYADIRDNREFRGEVPFTGCQGQTVWAWLQGTSIFPERAREYAVFSMTDITERKREQAELQQQKDELQASLDRVKRLEGIISICMYCKKIRNERESWEQLELYFSQHTDAEFSHGICPECFSRLASGPGSPGF